MAVSRDLVWLLNQLRNAQQPAERLRLLARGWRSLRELDAADRLRVAHELGIDGAEALVEQIARRGGASPAGLLAALETIRDAGPERLRDVVHRLVEPEGRQQLVAEMLEQAVAGAPEPSEPSPEEMPSLPAAPPSNEQHASPVLVEGDDDGAQEPSPAPAKAPTPSPAAPLVGAVETEGRPEAGPSTARRAGPPPSARPAAPVTAPPPAASTAAKLLGDLAAEGSLLRRLRMLRQAMPRLVDAACRDLGRLVEGFPAGWPRRRAVEALLEAGLPPTVEDALELIGNLTGPDRLWALTALVAGRSLDAADREAVLGSVDTPLVARRLQARLARS